MLMVQIMTLPGQNQTNTLPLYQKVSKLNDTNTTGFRAGYK